MSDKYRSEHRVCYSNMCEGKKTLHHLKIVTRRESDTGIFLSQEPMIQSRCVECGMTKYFSIKKTQESSEYGDKVFRNM